MERDQREPMTGAPAMRAEEVRQFLIDEEIRAEGNRPPRPESDPRKRTWAHVKEALLNLFLGGFLFLRWNGLWLFPALGGLFLCLAVFHLVQAVRAHRSADKALPRETPKPAETPGDDGDESLSAAAESYLRYSYLHGNPTLTEEEARQYVRQYARQKEKTLQEHADPMSPTSKLVQTTVYAAFIGLAGLYLWFIEGLSRGSIFFGCLGILVGGFLVRSAWRSYREEKTPPS